MISQKLYTPFHREMSSHVTPWYCYSWNMTLNTPGQGCHAPEWWTRHQMAGQTCLVCWPPHTSSWCGQQHSVSSQSYTVSLSYTCGTGSSYPHSAGHHHVDWDCYMTWRRAPALSCHVTNFPSLSRDRVTDSWCQSRSSSCHAPHQCQHCHVQCRHCYQWYWSGDHWTLWHRNLTCTIYLDHSWCPPVRGERSTCNVPSYSADLYTCPLAPVAWSDNCLVHISTYIGCQLETFHLILNISKFES